MSLQNYYNLSFDYGQVLILNNLSQTYLMNYKKWVRSRKVRIWILSMLSWVPDRIMIPLQYRIHTGRKLHLKNPTRFTEKLQLYKLRYRNPLMLRCTDKYEVRKVVEEMGLSDILIPLIGVYNTPTEIDFDSLPSEFVAKTTDGGGGNQVLICHDKSKLNRSEFVNTLNKWMSAPKGNSVGREWAYDNRYPRRIIIEKLLKVPEHNDVPDYKFFCFNGRPYYCQVIDNRSTTETIDFYDMEWRHQEFVGLNPDCRNSGVIAPIPANFDRIKATAEKLAGDYPLVRVDLYNTDESVWFGELTFYPASGFGQFTPDKWDERIGRLMLQAAGSPLFGGNYQIDRKLNIIAIEPRICDYKFFCFNGRVGMVYGINGRSVGENARLGIYTRDFVKLDVSRADEVAQSETMRKPYGYEQMVQIAEEIGKHFPHVRVDLYNIAGKIYFGELTFYDGSGYMAFTPDSYDEEIGAKFDISEFI